MRAGCSCRGCTHNKRKCLCSAYAQEKGGCLCVGENWLLCGTGYRGEVSAWKPEAKEVFKRVGGWMVAREGNKTKEAVYGCERKSPHERNLEQRVHVRGSQRRDEKQNVCVWHRDGHSACTVQPNRMLHSRCSDCLLQLHGLHCLILPPLTIIQNPLLKWKNYFVTGCRCQSSARFVYPRKYINTLSFQNSPGRTGRLLNHCRFEDH